MPKYDLLLYKAKIVINLNELKKKKCLVGTIDCKKGWNR